ncbi:MAG: acyltransferase family protein [Phycisphaerae bacterium]|nr:acyltransferase family protein [Phycisphaerae bacterium]
MQNTRQIGEPPGLSRRYDVDWLRVLGMAAVFLFHCGRFFDTENWHVKSPRTSEVVSFITLTVAVQWLMPLFFVLSGIGTYHSLTTHNWRQYLTSRFKRLAVPLVFGVFVVIAPYQVYLERVSHDQFSGSFWSFYPHYFEGWYGIQKDGNFAWMGLHLWYLEILFVFSAITLPLFLALRSRAGDRMVGALSNTMKVPGTVFLLAIPIAILEFLANSPALRNALHGLFNQRGFGGWSLLPYLAIFILGFLLASGKETAKAVESHRFAGLVVALVTFVVGYFLVKIRGLSESSIGFALIRGVLCWSCLIAILGFGGRHLRSGNRFLKYANEAVLPFYILHQTIILAIGFHVIRLDTPLWLEYLIIVASSFAATMALYELLIRRINALRFLFGLKPLRQQCRTRVPVPSP